MNPTFLDDKYTQAAGITALVSTTLTLGASYAYEEMKDLEDHLDQGIAQISSYESLGTLTSHLEQLSSLTQYAQAGFAVLMYAALSTLFVSTAVALTRTSSGFIKQHREINTI